MSFRFRYLLPALLLCGCVQEAPHTVTAELTDPACEGTLPGNACVSLHFRVSADIRAESPRPLTGRLTWGLFRAGDVEITGPGKNKPVKSTRVSTLDFTAEDATHDIVIPNVPAMQVQALAYLDTDSDGWISKGDPVTFPSAGFHLLPDQHTKVTLVFDYLR